MDNIIEWGGAAIIILLVFIETGFLLGLIVPGGETLLFSAGLLASVESLTLPLWVLILLLIISAFAGDCTGYWLGKKLGKKLHKRKDTLLFKKKYLIKAEDFYKRHQKRALILGRFLPIIRTFNPLLAGSSNMAITFFILLTGIGCVVYISTMVMAGYLLGNLFPQLGEYIEYIFLAVALIVTGGLIYNLIKERKETSH